VRREAGRIAAVVALVAASIAIGVTPAMPAPALATGGTRCKAVAGAGRITPPLTTTPGPVVLAVHAFRVSACDGVGGAAATATLTLKSAGASCPLAPANRLRGPMEIDWRDGSVTYVKAARVASAGDSEDPFAVRLDGRVSGGRSTGATLRVRLHLAPTSGDCTTGVGAFTVGNVSALTIGGPYATCATVAATATVSPGLAAAPAAQNLHFDSFRVSDCQASDTAPSANIIGAVSTPSASCPPAKQQRFHGMLEIDWANHFVSILKRAHLASANNPADPYELSLHGTITNGADAGAQLAVVLHATPTTGDCAAGVTGLSFTNVGPFTVS
jgi:hypothetical protein